MANADKKRDMKEMLIALIGDEVWPNIFLFFFFQIEETTLDRIYI